MVTQVPIINLDSERWIWAVSSFTNHVRDGMVSSMLYKLRLNLSHSENQRSLLALQWLYHPKRGTHTLFQPVAWDTNPRLRISLGWAPRPAPGSLAQLWKLANSFLTKKIRISATQATFQFYHTTPSTSLTFGWDIEEHRICPWSIPRERGGLNPGCVVAWI
jgi:hypothetical protein